MLNFHLKTLFKVFIPQVHVAILSINVLFFLWSGRASAQAPVITSINPSNGPTGTKVTIAGNNFNNSAGDVVYFGATKANIQSESSSQIIVSVPIGADYSPVSVTSNGLTGYSPHPFDVTFNGQKVISPQSFTKGDDIALTSGAYGIAAADFDGDGKVDVAAINSSGGLVSIFRNIGAKNNAVLAPAINYTVGQAPIGLAIADLNGDGKLDFAATNFSSGNVSIYLNTSTINNISFVFAATLQTGSNPYGIALSDFDGDGRPDMVIANETSYPATISVFQNLTVPSGNLAFGPKTDLSVGPFPRSLAIGDLNGDGKPDIVVANQGAASVSVLVNTSSGNGISFAAKTDFATTAGSSPESVAIADFDSDGKLDVAVANNNSSGTVTVFRNISNSGTLSLLPGQDFGTGSNPYSIAAADINGDGKPDIVVSNQLDNTVSVLSNSGNNTIAFNSKVDFATGGYPKSVAIADEDNDGIPDIIIGSNSEAKLTVLLNTSAAPDLTPTITSFTSNPAGSNSTVAINGTNFTGATAVSFGGVPAASFTVVSDELIVAIIGQGASGNVSIITPNGTASLGGFLFIDAPNISYQTPQIYTVNTPILPLTPANTGGAVPANGYGEVSTFAGSLFAGNADGYRTDARFDSPYGLAMDNIGNLYISDVPSHIRKISPAGDVTTLRTTGFNNNASADPVQFDQPAGLATDKSGNVFLAEYNRNLIKKITPSGVISPVAGFFGPNATAGGSIDGRGTDARFIGPFGLVFDSLGNLFVSEYDGVVLRKIDESGLVTMFAGLAESDGFVDGTGAAARFSRLPFLTIDASGNIFVSDNNNNAIRKISPTGLVTTIANWSASSPGIALTGTSVAVDDFGNVYFEDYIKGTIKKLSIDGVITVVAGNGSPGFVDGLPSVASFNNPCGLLLDGKGSLYVADNMNHAIRKVALTGYIIDKPLPAGLNFDPTTGIISGTATVANQATDYKITAYNMGGSSSTIVNITILANQIPAIPPPNISYSTPQTYTINKPINPLAPVNSGGAVPATVYGEVTTFAGTGKAGSANGQSPIATFNQPRAATVDASGNVYVTDDNNTIRKITPDGVVAPFAGTGAPGLKDGAGNIATFFNPNGMTVDNAGNIIVADINNNAIRKVSPLGVVSTVAGNGARSFLNGQGTSATFNTPFAVITDAAGNIFVADQFNFCIRKIDPTGLVSTFVGSGTYGSADGIGILASFSQITGLTIDALGNIYATDEDNNTIRKITPDGTVTTIAGSGSAGSADGAGRAASFHLPAAITIDPANNLYVADSNNQLIRKITPDGTVSTLAGNGIADFKNGIGAQASFSYPYGITTDKNGNLFVSDNQNNCFRKIAITGYTINKELPQGLAFDPKTGVISGTPIVSSPATTYTVTAYNASGSSITTVIIEVVVPKTLAFAPIASKTTCDGDFDPGATSISPIVYNSSTPSVATIVSGKIHVTGAGTTVITASDGVSQISQTLNVLAAVTPSVTITPVSPDDCINTAVTFKATAVNGGSNPDYQWKLNGQNVGSNSATFVSSGLNNNDQITCTLLSSIVCTTSASAVSNTAVFTVDPPATTSVTITSNLIGSICAGTPVTFTAQPTGNYNNPSYQWMINSQNTGITSLIFTTNTLKDGDVVSCVMNSSGKCLITPTTTSNSIKISLSPVSTCVIVIPNTFTPNGDGINDSWEITALAGYANCSVAVFNRYGQNVYSSTGYGMAWNGNYNGKVLQAGIYYYLIDLKNGHKPLSGFVTIVR